MQRKVDRALTGAPNNGNAKVDAETRENMIKHYGEGQKSMYRLPRGRHGGVGEPGRKGDTAVFKGCAVVRADPDGDYRRELFELVIADERHDLGSRKGSVSLGPGSKGWALPEGAEVTLPAGCAARMGSTVPYLIVTLIGPSKKGEEQEKDSAERDTAIRNSSALVREAATNLARLAGCGEA
ncbi:hypothetical protein ACH4OX_16905 [Streptomyces roseolus]|uniref:hypothetical protein n=1 Tax=Streptomyces roseolus TaxID=67358 RepID=UPI0037934E8C